MTKGMVCAPQPEAAEVGIETLKKGGNAVDAAIACALVQTAVDPQMCGIAGFGSGNFYMPDRNQHFILDFHSRAPAAATADMWEGLIESETEDGFGFILKGKVNEVGYGSIATPMTLQALDYASSQYGTMSFEELLQPAIEYAEQGVMVRPHMSFFWNLKEAAGRVHHKERVAGFSVAKRIYVKDNGELRRPGEILVNRDMAKLYRKIAEQGAGSFYNGEIARMIDADMQNNGGLLSIKDLQAVEATTTEPLWNTYRGRRISTNRPPGGGIMIIEMLNILECFDLAAMGHNSAEYIATISEAMKIATVDKDQKVGDPRFVDIPVEQLTSKEYAEIMAADIKSGVKKHVPRVGVSQESKDTTHICAVDENNNCVSLTHSLGMPSGIVSEGMGFMYNGAMAVFDPRSGRTGSIAPGKSRFTAICPTIVFENDAPKFIVGAPGGTYITMGVLQSILNVIDFGMDAWRAVSAPRICTLSDTIDITNRIQRAVEKELVAMGYNVRRSPLSYHFAGVHGISNENGKWVGGADPGRDGVAMEV